MPRRKRNFVQKGVVSFPLRELAPAEYSRPRNSSLYSAYLIAAQLAQLREPCESRTARTAKIRAGQPRTTARTPAFKRFAQSNPARQACHFPAGHLN